jgi:hypothetical protein
MTTTLGNATVTAPAVGASSAIAALNKADAMLTLTVTALSCASGGPPRARFLFEDSTDAFTTPLPIAFANVEGPITPDAPVSLSWKLDHIPSIRVGVANGVLRCSVAALEGTSPSCSFVAGLVT